MTINSRAKGARGERMWRDEIIGAGFMARRGQQFSGGADSPDVICEDLSHLHFEVKFVQSLNVRKAMVQAIRDGKNKTPIVAHKTNNSPWLVTMTSDDFFKLIKESL